MTKKIARNPDERRQTPRGMVPGHPAVWAVHDALAAVWRETAPHPVERRVVITRALQAATVLADALCQVATQIGEPQDLDAATEIANAAYAALCRGPASLAARISLIERIEFLANVTEGWPKRERAKRASGEAGCYRSTWPEYADGITDEDFAMAAEKWNAVKSSPRAGKWRHIVSMMRRAGLNPPSVKSLEAQWSRHLAARRSVVWDWDGKAWVGTPTRRASRPIP